jgi:peptidoglycan/LPS O-acetylase OafA/YrhL
VGRPDLNPLVANLSKREIPSLNGLRGIAALAVAIWHYLDQWKLSYLFPGPFAVTLFFELSGLLITWLLLNEMEQTGGLDRRRFYLRRALRLFPVFYVVWALCRFAGPFAGSWAYFFYLGDYYTAIRQNYSVMTQAWSLGVEEKFYLLWPFILAGVRRPMLIKILVGVLIVEPLYRAILSSAGFRTYTWFAFDTRLDPIVLGCLIAVFAKQGWIAPKWLSHSITPILALFLVFVFQRIPDLVTYLLAIILVSVICRPTTFLNSRIIRYFGAISYSLYLCHGYARDSLWQRTFGNVHFSHWSLALVSQLAVAIALASVLHFSVERPFLRLKNRLRRKPFTPRAAVSQDQATARVALESM